MFASARMFRLSAGKTCQIAEDRSPATTDEADEPAAAGPDPRPPPDPGSPPSPDEGGLDVNGTQLCASTLASVSAAVVASIFGVTGTIVGAAVMSVIATTGSALYTHGIRRTGAKLQQTPVADLTRRLGPWPRAGDDPTEAASADAAPSSTSGPTRLSRRPAEGWREWLADRRWGVVAGVGVVFAATLGVVTLVELAGQHSLAGITGDSSGRTSIGSLFDGSSSEDDSPGSTDPAGGASTTVAPGEDPAVTDDPAGSTDPDSPDATDPPDDTVDSTEPSSPTDPSEPPADDAPSAADGAAAAAG